METTLSGLTVRVDEDKRDNLEVDFSPPPSSSISVKGQKMKVSFYVFKRESADKYRSSEGIVFVINGQTHGYLSKRFFSRNSVRLGYLADSLLLLVDCSEIEGRAREDLFMNSRDRLRSGDLASEIERRLEEMLREHPGLKALNSRRRKEDTENKLDDSKPLQEIIETILEKSPTLSKLFVKGLNLPDPFDLRPASKKDDYVGEKFPTHFKLVQHYPISSPKKSPINRRLRIQYKTDANNDYFDRDMDTGEFNLKSGSKDIQDFSVNLWNGIATLNINLPESVKVDDLIHFTSFVSDNSRPDPFIEDFYIEILPEVKKHPGIPGGRKPPSSKDGGNEVDELANLNLPNLIEVRQDNWDDHGFDRNSALKVIDSGEEGYDFYINMHNIHLLTEKKEKSEESALLIDAKYKYSLVLIGLAMIKDQNEKLEDESYTETNDSDIFEDIKRLSEVLSPIMIPMIDGLGELSEEELERSYDGDQ